MTYYESAEGVMISHKRALQEINEHGLSGDIEMFYEDCGKRDTYEAQEVLQWLGY